MAEQSQFTQPSSSPAQTPSNPASAPTSKQALRSVVVATASTKYDVLPPRTQQPAASIQPISGLNSQAQNSPPSGPRSMVHNSAELLASARAKLAATKQATEPAVSGPSQNVPTQEFEITHLKTIKCDVCQQKNTNFLYKCQDCTFNHQICSICVEHTDPKPAEGGTGRRDWNVHAKLKDAHAAYSQPMCLGKKEDGSYEHNGIKFVLAPGKKGGMRQPKKTTPKRDVIPAERKTSVRRATGGHSTSEQGQRNLARVISRLERGQDEELKARVEAARARRDKEAQVTVGAQAEEKKRKADVLGENNDGDDADDDGEDVDDDGEGVDDDGDDTEQKLDEGDDQDHWDELETVAAMRQSTLDIAPLRRRGRSNRRKFQHVGRFRSITLSPPPSVSRFREYPTGADLSPVGRMPPLLAQQKRPSATDSFTSQDARTKARREPSPERPQIYTPESLTQSENHQHISEMQITARKSASRKPAARPLAAMLETRRKSAGETRSPSTEFFSDSTYGDEPPQDSQYNSQITISAHLPCAHEQEQEAELRRRNFLAQRDLQHVSDKGKEDADAYAQDRLGISMLLQASKFVEDRDRVEQIEQERTMQLDGQSANTAAQSAEPPGSDEFETLSGASEFDTLSNTSRQAEMQPTTPFPWLDPSQHGRRSERLASLNLRPHLYTRPRQGRADARGSRTEQLPPAAAAAAVAENINTPEENVRQRIKALEDKAAAASKGKLKRDWDPLVKGYIKEQQAKRRKTTQWLVEQESSEEEGYDNGVEGGFWVQSDDTGSGSGIGGREGDMGDTAVDDDGSEAEGEHGRVGIETKGSEDDGDNDDDNDPQSDPILAPSTRRGHGRGMAEDDGDGAGSAMLEGRWK